MSRGRATRRIPRKVWVAAALFVGLLLGWSVLSPVARPPDEGPHVDVVMHLASGGDYPEFDERHPSAAVVRLAIAHAPGLGGKWLTSDNAPPKDRRPTLAEAGGGRPAASINQIPQHPPLYYWSMGAALRVQRWVTPGGDAALDREWNVLRLFNVALLAPLPVIAWAAARRLGVGARAAETAAFLPLAIPQLCHIGASVNNDNLLVLTAGLVSVGVAGVLTGDDRRSTAGLIGIAAAVAVLTKAFGFLLLPWVVMAYGYQVIVTRSGRTRGPTNLLLAVGPAAVAGGAWLARNLVEHDELLPSSLAAEFARPRAGFEPDLFEYARSYGAGLVRSSWGSFGAHEARLGDPVVVLATAAVVGLLLVGVRGRRPATGGEDVGERLVRLLFLALPALLTIVLVVQDHDSYRFSGLHPFMQGRYLFAALVPVMVVVAAGIVHLLGRRGPLVVLAAATVLQALSVREALSAWWGAPGSSVGESVSALVAWSTWPSWLIAVGAVALAVGWVIAIVVSVVEPDPVTLDQQARHSGLSD